jgi:hypothetical protein
MIYRYKYATDFVNVGIILLNIETKETKSGCTGSIIKHIALFFHRVVYSSYNAPLSLL